MPTEEERSGQRSMPAEEKRSGRRSMPTEEERSGRRSVPTEEERSGRRSMPTSAHRAGGHGHEQRERGPPGPVPPQRPPQRRSAARRGPHGRRAEAALSQREDVLGRVLLPRVAQLPLELRERRGPGSGVAPLEHARELRDGAGAVPREPAAQANMPAQPQRREHEQRG